MIFNQNQIEELLNIVRYNHLLFIVQNVGGDVLSISDKSFLKNFGIDVNVLASQYELNPVEMSFRFGILSSALGDKRAKDLSYNQFKKFLGSGKFVPLTSKEKFTLESVKQQSYSRITNLGKKIEGQVTEVVHSESNKRKSIYEKILRDETKRTVEDRRSVQDMILRMGERTDDWERDLGRLVETELHYVYEEGRAADLERKSGVDVLVYKDVYPGACRWCIKLYTTNGIGSRPRVFKLSELRKNGDNVGKKPQDWKPIVGAVHPFDRCTLNEVPEGYDWNEETRSFDIPKEYVRKVARKSKVKVSVITGQEEFKYEV